MTQEEEGCIRELAGDVRELTGELRHTNENISKISTEVWGVEGDPQRSGLKGQMQDVRLRLMQHDQRFAAIDKSKIWLWDLNKHALVAVIAAILGFLAKHILWK